MGRYIMVLNDGTTWTDLDGCFIAEVADDFDDDILPYEVINAVVAFSPETIILKAPLTARGVAHFPLTPVSTEIDGQPILYGNEI